jgi:catalase
MLVADGSDAKAVDALRKAAESAGAMVKLVAPKRYVTLKGAKPRKADGQLAGTPSVLFDAVACVLTPDAAKMLATEAAALDWFRDAFGHLKAIAACGGTRTHILPAAGIEPDKGVVDTGDVAQFIRLAKTRQWEREPTLRTLP